VTLAPTQVAHRVARRGRTARAGNWLETLGVGASPQRRCRASSHGGGEAQRVVAIARAMAMEPPALLMDGADRASLDPARRGELGRGGPATGAGRTLSITTHDDDFRPRLRYARP